MGSLCKSGPSTTTSNSTSTYTPAGMSQLNDIWGRVSAAASTPYEAYSGPMVADLNATQRGGIDNITGATSYLDTARDYASAGAAPIGEGDISRYYNPFQRDVIGATMRNFQEGNAIQDERLKGDAISAGAWGGDRAGIARAELARTQKLAQDPVIAGLNSQGFNLALAAAQADRAAKAQGGYQFGALGGQAVGQGQAQIGAGSLEQGTDQARLAAAYQKFLEERAFPYQQAQFLASTGLPVVSAMGGTTAGQSQSQTQQASPSPLSQIAGLATAGIGLMSGNPFGALGGLGGMGSIFGGGNPSSAAYGSNPFTPYGTVNPAYGFARGGRAGMKNGGRAKPRGFDHGGFVETVHAIRQSLRGGGRVMDMTRGPGGVYSAPGYADGGPVDFNDRFAASYDPTAPVGLDPMALQDSHFAQFGADPAAFRGAAPFGDVPLPQARPAAPFVLPPQITNPGGGGEPIMLPPSAMAYSGARPTGGLRAPVASPPIAPSPVAASLPAFMPGAAESAPSGPFGLSEDARMGLIAAGLGMMSSKSPNAIGAIGEGGVAGLKHYTEAKSGRQRNEIAARKLLQDAQQFSQGHDLRERSLEESARRTDVMSEDRRDAQAERERAARERSEDRRDLAAGRAYPGEGLDENGVTVKGLYQWNPDTREYDFKAGKVLQKGTGAGARPSARQEMIENLRKENPGLSYQEALALTQRAPNADQGTLRRESLALSAAKGDIGYLRDPQGTLEKWRKQYGLSGGAAGLKKDPGALDAAKAAIAKGAPKAAVEKRLRDAGIDPSGL